MGPFESLICSRCCADPEDLVHFAGSGYDIFSSIPDLDMNKAYLKCLNYNRFGKYSKMGKKLPV